MTALPPQNIEAEVSVLGAVLLMASDAGQAVGGLVADEGLRAEHFYRPRNQLVFEAIVGLYDSGEAIDQVTVCERLGSRLEEAGGQSYVHSLPSSVPAPGNFRHYARIVIDAARWRTVLEAGRRIAVAASAADRDELAEAEALLVSPERGKRASRESRQHAVMEILDSGGLEGWRWPFSEVNDLVGGAYRGQFTVLLGHEGHGKSAWLRQVLDYFHRQGARAALYTNEMTPEEIDLRFVARESGVPYLRLAKGRIYDGEHKPVIRAVELIGQGIEVVSAEGWTAEDIVHDVKRRAWDAVGLDLLNGVAGGREVRDIDHNMQVLAACSRQVGCHLIAAQHLNAHRTIGQSYPPEPNLLDVRGSASIRQLANNVMAVHRFEEEIGGERTGTPGEDAVVKWLKARGGVPGRVLARFDGARMRFLPKVPEAPSVAVVA